MNRRSIGDQELALLQHVDQAGEVAVGEVAGLFGEPRGLARSTVLTMMERLRAKGYLKRRRIDGLYRYTTTTGQEDLMQGAVATFVEKTLQGSVNPFVVWMSRRGKVSDEELAALQELVEKLQTSRKKG